MTKFIIEGPSKLSGEIEVKGAKNAALKIIPAALLSAEKIKISNLPIIEDISKSIEVLEGLGAEIIHDGSVLEIDPSNIATTELNPHLANKFRASIMFVGPLLARFGKVKFPHPGGCVIGAGGRPIDLFLDGFKAFGATVEMDEQFYNIEAKKLTACNFFFPGISVTATEALMMVATLAEGTTVLENCAMEPEIKALADYLNEQGAKIEGAGTPTMKITGVEKIGGGDFEVIPDRIETGSFAIMAAITKSELTIRKCRPVDVRVLLNIFEKVGIPFETGDDWIKIMVNGKFKPYSIKTHEFPGFPTDLQPPYTVLMTQAEGSCMIHETIYDRRLQFTDMLCQMGANITMCDPHRVVVNGPTPLHGKQLTSPDLRAGITLMIAAMIAEGKTEIDNIYQIDRGYENIDERLKSIGVNIKRIKA